ncbi:hypothetical protein V1477_012872 [Vespula maculifrons]
MLPGWDYEFSIISDRSKTNDEIFHHVSVYLARQRIFSRDVRWPSTALDGFHTFGLIFLAHPIYEYPSRDTAGGASVRTYTTNRDKKYPEDERVMFCKPVEIQRI